MPIVRVCSMAINPDDLQRRICDQLCAAVRVERRPDGELMLGLKIENTRALVNVEVTTQVPGIAFAEWGPGDMSMAMGYKNAPGEPWPEELWEARERVRKACKNAGIAFLEGATPDTIAAKIDEGIRVVSSGGPHGEATAKAGRAHSKRTMPV